MTIAINVLGWGCRSSRRSLARLNIKRRGNSWICDGMNLVDAMLDLVNSPSYLAVPIGRRRQRLVRE